MKFTMTDSDLADFLIELQDNPRCHYCHYRLEKSLGGWYIYRAVEVNEEGWTIVSDFRCDDSRMTHYPDDN